MIMAQCGFDSVPILLTAIVVESSGFVMISIGSDLNLDLNQCRLRFRLCLL